MFPFVSSLISYTHDFSEWIKFREENLNTLPPTTSTNTLDISNVFLLNFITYFRRRFHDDPDHRHRILRHSNINHVAILRESSNHQPVDQDEEKDRKIRTARSGWNGWQPEGWRQQTFAQQHARCENRARAKQTRIFGSPKNLTTVFCNIWNRGKQVG